MAGSKYGVLDLIWDIRDAHSICEGDALGKSILMAIASRADASKGFTAYPSMQMIAGDVAASERSVRQRVGVLVEAGLLSRQRRYDSSYLYIVAVSTIKSAAEEQRKIWATEKEQRKMQMIASEDASSDFGRVMGVNRALSAKTDESSADAEFPAASPSSGVDYIVGIQEAVEGFNICDSEEAYSFAVDICREFPGCAPLVALADINEDTTLKIKSARNPMGFLRSVIRRAIESMPTDAPRSTQETIESWVMDTYKDIRGGYSGLNISLPITVQRVEHKISEFNRRFESELKFDRAYISGGLDDEGHKQITFEVSEVMDADEDPSKFGGIIPELDVEPEVEPKWIF